MSNVALLQNWVHQPPNCWRPLYGFTKLDNWSRPRRCYRQVLAAQPNLAEGHFRLGEALRGQGKFDEAVAAYRQAIDIKPDFGMAHSNLLFCLNSDD
jgi:tetratricopeptide (TPR) repeat protein